MSHAKKARRLNLSRRSFVKTLAVAGAAATLTQTKVSPALAETGTNVPDSNDVKRIRTCCRGCGKME